MGITALTPHGVLSRPFISHDKALHFFPPWLFIADSCWLSALSSLSLPSFTDAAATLHGMYSPVQMCTNYVLSTALEHLLVARFTRNTNFFISYFFAKFLCIIE